MTRYGDRDTAGRLPLTPEGEPACGRLLALAGVACQAPPGHEPPCRHYSPEDGRFEWWPQADVALPVFEVSSP